MARMNNNYSDATQKLYDYLESKKPKVAVSDNKINKRDVTKLARENDHKTIFVKIYPSYRFNDMKINYNDFVSGAYNV